MLSRAIAMIIASLVAVLVLSNSVHAANEQLVAELQQLGKAVDDMAANISNAETDADAQVLVGVTQQTLAIHLGPKKQTVAIDGKAGQCNVLITGPNWKLWSRAEKGKIVDHGATISGK
jgi:hypothetical protein